MSPRRHVVCSSFRTSIAHYCAVCVVVCSVDMPCQPSDPTWFLGNVVEAFGRFVKVEVIVPSGVTASATLVFVELKDQSASSNAFLLSAGAVTAGTGATATVSPPHL